MSSLELDTYYENWKFFFTKVLKTSSFKLIGCLNYGSTKLPLLAHKKSTDTMNLFSKKYLLQNSNFIKQYVSNCPGAQYV